MELTRTIRSDKRYYLDERSMINGQSLVETMERYNDMKIALYNQMYDSRFLNCGPLTSQTYASWLKQAFHTNDYYNAAVYSEAAAALASQSELRKLYRKGRKRDLANRKRKLDSVAEELEKKRQIKDSLKVYAITGRWEVPYPHCLLKICGKKVQLPGGKYIPVDSYERDIEKKIRTLKTRLALLKESYKRTEKKLSDLETYFPRRILFGSREFYQKKDAPDTDRTQWKEAFYAKRHASMCLPGRHTSKNCNFLVSCKGGDLYIRCMDGKEAVLKNFSLSREQQLREDHKKRTYLCVSVVLVMENKYLNFDLCDGCVSIDLNFDHVALSDIDKDGNLMDKKVLRFGPEAKTNGQISDMIGRMMSRVGAYCADRKKPLIMEDLDTTITKFGMKYSGRTGNRHASVFAYRKMTACIENQSMKRGFGVIKIDPAYTSQMGKFLFMKQKGISIHEAASYAIGLKGMEFVSLLHPPEQMLPLLPVNIQAALEKKDRTVKDILPAWKKVTEAFRGVRTHSFYRGVPYPILKDKKRPTLMTLSSEMKSWEVDRSVYIL